MEDEKNVNINEDTNEDWMYSEENEEYTYIIDSEPVLQVSPTAMDSKVLVIKSDINITDDKFSKICEIYPLPSAAKGNIQKTYMGSKYIYFIRNSSDPYLLHLSRIPIPKVGERYNASNVTVYRMKDSVHSQLLDFYEYNGGNFFWTGCGKTSDNNKWATEIGRFKYSTDNTGIKIVNTQRLNNLNYANKKGITNGTIKRVEAAVSPNKKYLLIMARCRKKDETITCFSVYDAFKLNKLLSDNKNTSVFDCNNKKYGNIKVNDACIKSGTCSSKNTANAILHKMSCGSNSGLAIDNNMMIYYSSDKLIKGKNSKNEEKDYREGKLIFKISLNNNSLKVEKCYYFVGPNNVKDKNDNTIPISFTTTDGKDSTFNLDTEMEGMQIVNGKIQFAEIYREHGIPITTINRLKIEI